MVNSGTMAPKGGKRPGAGRKSKYDEPTTVRTFRVPVSLDEKIQDQSSKREISASELITNILRRHLRQKK